jgi:hypothetical protein
VTKSYGILNPSQLIELFEMRARLADLMASSISPLQHHKAAGEVWREAADIVRHTEFVGWKDTTTPPTEQRKQHDGHDEESGKPA